MNASGYGQRVIAQVSGLNPDRVWSRRLMVLQAFVDDSTTEQGNFVLAGYLATAEEWLRFSEEWGPLARSWGTLQPDGNYIFKMRDMAALPERRERVAAFYRIIERHDLAGFAVGMNKRSFARAKQRLWISKMSIDWDIHANPFNVLFFFLISNLVSLINEFPSVWDPKDKIDFIFDEQREKSRIRAAWDTFIGPMESDIRQRLGREPRFESDADFLPLQAADFYAWWNSRWLDQGFKEGLPPTSFEWFESTREKLTIRGYLSEDEIVRLLKRLIRARVPNAVIYEHVIDGGQHR